VYAYDQAIQFIEFDDNNNQTLASTKRMIKIARKFNRTMLYKKKICSHIRIKSYPTPIEYIKVDTIFNWPKVLCYNKYDNPVLEYFYNLSRVVESIKIYFENKLKEYVVLQYKECYICCKNHHHMYTNTCNHSVCYNCLFSWIFEEKNNSCPFCRKNIDVASLSAYYNWKYYRWPK